MQEFMRFYNEKKDQYGWNLQIYHSSIVDWCIQIGYKTTHPKHGDIIINIQDCDMELAFAKAQVKLKKWLLINEGGY